MTEKPLGKRKETRNVVLWVTGAFVLGIITWGASMWVVKKNMTRTMFLIMNERTRVKSIELWVQRAEGYKFTYEYVLKHPRETVGKPVIWELAGKNILWTNPEKVAPGKPVAVALVKEVGPSGVRLQYLGYSETPAVLNP